MRTEQQIIETLATKVMQWIKDTSVLHFEWIKPDGTRMLIRDWDPLQNIADAWQVIDKLVADRWLYELSNERDGYKQFILGGNPKKPGRYEAYGATPQEAICKAALKVVA